MTEFDDRMDAPHPSIERRENRRTLAVSLGAAVIVVVLGLLLNLDRLAP